jgi:hypothetical protein
MLYLTPPQKNSFLYIFVRLPPGILFSNEVSCSLLKGSLSLVAIGSGKCRRGGVRAAGAAALAAAQVQAAEFSAEMSRGKGSAVSRR